MSYDLDTPYSDPGVIAALYDLDERVTRLEDTANGTPQPATDNTPQPATDTTPQPAQATESTPAPSGTVTDVPQPPAQTGA